MLNIESVRKSPRVTAPIFVVISGVTDVTTDDTLRAMAYDAANERPESCFGSHVNGPNEDGSVTVSIYRD